MLVVRAEIWPGGDRGRAYTIGEIVAANESDLAPVSSYSVSINQVGARGGGVRAWRKNFVVEGHERTKGAWKLVAAILAMAFSSENSEGFFK